MEAFRPNVEYPYNPTLLWSEFVFLPTYFDGVRVGVVQQSNTADVIVGPGPGGGPEVQILSGTDGQLIDGFIAFDPSASAGLFVGGLR